MAVLSCRVGGLPARLAVDALYPQRRHLLPHLRNYPAQKLCTFSGASLQAVPQAEDVHLRRRRVGVKFGGSGLRGNGARLDALPTSASESGRACIRNRPAIALW